MSQNSFYVWRRKLKHASRKQAELFVPVVIESATQVAIEFPCGAVVKVDNQVDSMREQLASKLKTVRSNDLGLKY